MGRDAIAVVEHDYCGDGKWEVFAVFPDLPRYTFFDKIAAAPKKNGVSAATFRAFEEFLVCTGPFIFTPEEFQDLGQIPSALGAVLVTAYFAHAAAIEAFSDAAAAPRSRIVVGFDQ